MSIKGIIAVNAYAPEIMTRQVRRIKDELAARGVMTEAVRNDGFPFSVAQDIKGKLDCDFCVYLDKDKYIAALAEKSGIRLFNRARAIELCDDKMLTHITLANHDIPMPETLPGLLCYDDGIPLSECMLDEVEARLGYPLVIKQAFGSMGKGVYKADNRCELKEIAKRVKTMPHLFQKFIGSAAGRDMRVIVIGRKVIGGIIRSSDGDFRSNIGLGGHAVKTEVPSEIATLAEKAADVLGLDYCGIDFLLSPEPLLIEVNSNAFFDAFEAATNINVAGAYADRIANQMCEIKKEYDFTNARKNPYTGKLKQH